ncbi:hypothetical protein K438DRAFT_720036 [Mycena galopus ATCC 62051]|nr:hypothetical protein K438DRAFT_720036 [Mycena galopus ATCC 62051]
MALPHLSSRQMKYPMCFKGFVRLIKGTSSQVSLCPVLFAWARFDTPAAPLARNATLEAIRLQTHSWRRQCQALLHLFFLPFSAWRWRKNGIQPPSTSLTSALSPPPSDVTMQASVGRCGAGRARFILTLGRMHTQISRIAAFESRSRATRQPCHTSTAVGTPVHCFDTLRWRLLPGRNCPRPRSRPPPPPPVPLSIGLCFFDDNTLSSFSSDSW